MRVLMLSPVLPSPFRGRRPYNFLHGLRGEHQVRLLALPYQGGGADEAARLERELDISVRMLPQSHAHSLLRCATFWYRPAMPLRALYCEHAHVARALRQEVQQFQPDVVHIDRLRMAGYVAHVAGAPTLVDLPDALTLYYERVRQTAGGRAAWIAAVELPRIQRYERQWLPRATAALVCSPVDRDHIAAYAPAAPLRVITNAVDGDEFRPMPPATARPPRLVFTGTLSYLPNLDGLLWYLRHVAPLLRKMGVDPTPTVAGVSWNPRKVSRALQGHQVRLRGYMERMVEALSPADVYLCPLRIGAGIRNKLLEAMACGMACVSTTMGYEGMAVAAGTHLLAGDTPEAFAEQVRAALNDEALRARLGAAARGYALGAHSLPAVGKALTALYRKLAAAPR